jgi:hypothetical protein
MPYALGSLIAFCFIIASAKPLFGITYTVAKDGFGDFTTITAAVKKAQPGDIVKITDLSTYAEQVTIDSTKNGLTLTSKNPTDINKPKIVWRDMVNVGPRNYEESRIDSLWTYQWNGAVRVMNTRNITIDGIAIDGGSPFCFGYDSIWESRYPLQHGNCGLVLWKSGAIHVKNCSISNAYFGIYCSDDDLGGIFANPNPADNEPWNVVRLSGFGKTGNHIIEHNRIHDNSVGLSFESCWDLGSTIRYNCIYENHHYSDAFAVEVKSKTSEGPNQPGGAMMFKDVMITPFAIYNNTFWHNFLELIGNWKVGYHNLVFNNIFSQPYRYFSDETIVAASTYMEISPLFRNRMNNCVFAAHGRTPDSMPINIFIAMPQPDSVNGRSVPGGLITSMTSFPAAADIRWLETPFLSTDTANANFLVPNWNDTLIQRYISDKGWAGSGVRDPDGSPADLGALPQGGGRPMDVATIIPISPVLLTGNSAAVSLTLSNRIGSMTAPSIKLHRWIGNLPYDANAWSSAWAAGVISPANITSIPSQSTPVVIGSNAYSFAVPTQTADYGFLEMVVEGTGSNTFTYTSTVGFIPYRKLGYKFSVDVLDKTSGAVLTQVRAGDTVVLLIRAYNADNTIFPNTVKPAVVRLQSGFTLYATDTNPAIALTLPQGVPGTTDGSRNNVMFTKIPAVGIESVVAVGQYVDGTKVMPFLGSCNIKILPGDPETVVFQDPPSIKFGAVIPIIDQGISYPGLLYVYDRFGNRVDQLAKVNLSSLQPNVGDIAGTSPVSITTDAKGSGIFQVQVTNGLIGQIFLIRADLPGKQPDTARLKVGKMNSVIPLNRNFLPIREYIVTFYDLKGRTILSRTVKSSAPIRKLEHLASPLTYHLSQAIYLIQITEKGKLSSLRQQCLRAFLK